MSKLLPLLAGLILWSGAAVADPTVDENAVQTIRAELSAAARSADMAPFKKYLYSGSKIIVDLDPSPSAGEMEIGYDDYMGMLEMVLPMMRDADIHEELISITVDAEKNQAVLKDKTIATMDMMGLKIQDVSVSETTFGVVGGEIKVLVARDQLISTGPVE